MGDLKKYLINHRSDFKHSLRVYNQDGKIEQLTCPDVPRTKNNLFLLYRWAFQVKCSYYFISNTKIASGLKSSNSLFCNKVLYVVSNLFNMSNYFNITVFTFDKIRVNKMYNTANFY